MVTLHGDWSQTVINDVQAAFIGKRESAMWSLMAINKVVMRNIGLNAQDH
jgi:hypothetical protein